QTQNDTMTHSLSSLSVPRKAVWESSDTTKINVTNKPNMHGCILWDEVFPGSCRTCMTIVSRVQKQIGSDKSKDKIRRLLDGACNKLKFNFLKSACRKILKTVKNKLIDALTNGKSAKTICTNLKLCKATFL
uniref:Saposin B-type domain-containing protein n=1 Tax=Maylandia zebra TaxID=106582 RepID=A0A3P9BA66_9CICH